MGKQKIKVDMESFPPEVGRFFAGANVYDSSSFSGAKVYYCDTGYYVKVDSKGELAQEAGLCRFFHRKGLGVEVAAYISRDRDYLVTRSASGENLTHYLDQPERLCRELADTLRNLHGQPVDGAPVSARYQRYMDSVHGDYSGGCYDEYVLMDRFPVHSKKEAWEIMQANKDRLKPDTLIHGDTCLPNVIFNHWRFESFIDFHLSGIGDKHIDLYWAVWSLKYNLKTDKYTDYFLDAYGRDRFDYEMLRVIAAFELFG